MNSTLNKNQTKPRKIIKKSPKKNEEGIYNMKYGRWYRNEKGDRIKIKDPKNRPSFLPKQKKNILIFHYEPHFMGMEGFHIEKIQDDDTITIRESDLGLYCEIYLKSFTIKEPRKIIKKNQN